MATLEAIRAEGEAAIARAGGTLAEQNDARARLAAGLEAERQARVRAVVDEERRAQQANPLRAAAGTVGAGVLGYTDAALFGHLANVASLGSGERKERVQIALEAARKTNPLASGVGQFAGYLDPRSLAGRATGAIAKGAGTLTGATALVEKAALRPFLTRASAATLNNLTGSAAALAATNLVEGDKLLEDRSIGQRLTDAVHQIASPINVGLSVAGGSLVGKYLRPVDQELKPLFEKYRRITGREITPDIAGDRLSLASLYDFAARVPGLADDVAATAKRLVGGLNEMVRGIGRDAGAIEGQTGRAAQVVRGLTERVTAARRGPEAAALTREGQNLLPPKAQASLLANVASAIADRAPTDPRGAPMSRILKDLGAAAKQGPLSVDALEAVRKRLGQIAFAVNPTDPLNPAYAARGRVEAGRLYAIVDSAIESHAPDFSAALRAGEKLRRMEEALGDVKVSDIHDRVLQSFWSGDHPLQRLKTLQRFGTPEDVGAAKGWLFTQLVRHITNADDAQSAVKLTKAMNERGGIFNRQILDAALPGVSTEMPKIAAIYDRARRGVMHIESAPTATRLMRGIGIAFNASASATLLAAFLHNPFLATGAALGAAGTKWVVQRGLRDMLTGHTADALSRLGQGQVPPPISRGAVAVQQAGGASGLGQLGVQGAGAVGQTIGQAAQLFQPQQETRP